MAQNRGGGIRNELIELATQLLFTVWSMPARRREELVIAPATAAGGRGVSR